MPFGNPCQIALDAKCYALPVDTSVGLRERKKLRTRADLSDAAFRLFAERGFDETTIEDIVEQVEVSPRTFFRYFDSKEDVVIGFFDDLGLELRAMLAARPPEEPSFTALRAGPRIADRPVRGAPGSRRGREAPSPRDTVDPGAPAGQARAVGERCDRGARHPDRGRPLAGTAHATARGRRPRRLLDRRVRVVHEWRSTGSPRPRRRRARRRRGRVRRARSVGSPGAASPVRRAND